MGGTQGSSLAGDVYHTVVNDGRLFSAAAAPQVGNMRKDNQLLSMSLLPSAIGTKSHGLELNDMDQSGFSSTMLFTRCFNVRYQLL